MQRVAHEKPACDSLFRWTSSVQELFSSLVFRNQRVLDPPTKQLLEPVPDGRNPYRLMAIDVGVAASGFNWLISAM